MKDYITNTSRWKTLHSISISPGAWMSDTLCHLPTPCSLQTPFVMQTGSVAWFGVEPKDTKMNPARPQLGIWVDFLIFVDFWLVFIENLGFGASPARTSVASIPAGGFFFLMSLLRKNLNLNSFPMFFLQNDYYLSSNRGTTYKTSILDPIEFWWVA